MMLRGVCRCGLGCTALRSTPCPLLMVLERPEAYLPAEEVAEYRRCQQSVIDARRSAEANEGQRYIG